MVDVWKKETGEISCRHTLYQIVGGLRWFFFLFLFCFFFYENGQTELNVFEEAEVKLCWDCLDTEMKRPISDVNGIVVKQAEALMRVEEDVHWRKHAGRSNLSPGLDTTMF